ncbi:hypothetical protein KFE25_008407 [Diacronema lutheri]|uniref:Vesicle transport protein n=2 Tax=Diacronema lutheri TaxID=2081491 RepID=A0A8J5X8U0_DIALT|nr:hypothetical protein KFE25_008407 [Diacronema lutheri]
MGSRGSWFGKPDACGGLSEADRRQPLLLDEELPPPRAAASTSWRWLIAQAAEPPPPQPLARATPALLSSRLEERLRAFRKPQPPPVVDAPCVPALSLRQRVLGFAACFVLGSVLSLGSISAFASLLAGNPAPFALQFSAGNLLSTLSTGFIVGFRTQARSMAEHHRALSALVFVGSMLATLALTLLLSPHGLVVLACIAVQYGAMVWYIASYIPFGRSMLAGCCRASIRSVTSAFDESL